jgi:two-component system CheB/CheR fusion protein
MSLLRESVRGAVRIALNKAMTQNETACVRDGVIDTEHGKRRVEVTVAPLEFKAAPSHYIISFETVAEPAPAPASSSADGFGTEDRRLMEEELRRMREELQNNVEELQTSNEELKASNEEVTSINEELQSSNEELETSKEELQSLNEELTTVNAQLETKMEELEGLTSDLSSLLSSTNIAVMFLDTQFRIRRFTPATKDLMELIPTDVGRPVNDMARKFTDPKLMIDVETVLEKLVPLESEVIGENGRTYIRRVLPYRTTDDRIGGVVVTFVDISRRHEAESALRESEQRHRLIIQSVKDYAIMMLDTSGRFTTWPPGAERVIGFSEAEAIGQNWEMLFTPEDRKADEPAKRLMAARESGSISDERWCLRKGGGQFWCSGVVSAVLDADGKVQGFVNVIHDNTHRKRTEAKLQQATQAAEAANEAKDQFLANVSHELRTPLSAMLIWANMLGEAQNPAPGQLREGLEAIRRSAESQKALIEDLLDTSRISSGKLRLEPREIELASVVHAAVETIRPAATTKGVGMEEKLDAQVGVVNADPHRMQQVIWNLLSNAVKFTPPGGRIMVDLKRHGVEVEFRVRDTGCGINAEFLPHVFDRFGQAESSPEAQGGLGLGLTIAKQLVELHGGTISAQSPGHGHGAIFTIRLPMPALGASPHGRRSRKPAIAKGEHEPPKPPTRRG